MECCERKVTTPFCPYCGKKMPVTFFSKGVYYIFYFAGEAHFTEMYPKNPDHSKLDYALA